MRATALMPDPSYLQTPFCEAPPRVRRAAAHQQRFIECRADCAAWGHARGVCCWLHHPATGTSIHPDEMRRIAQVVSAHGGITLIDEIYLGLEPRRHLWPIRPGAGGRRCGERPGDDIISINSFSKCFQHDGWRLGWLVVPSGTGSAIERLAKTCSFVPAPSASWRLLACFELRELCRVRAPPCQVQGSPRLHS